MKIQLDFDNKTISIENNVNLKEFIATIKKVIPDWQEWELKTNTTINWHYPYYQTYPYQHDWWNYPLTTDGTGTSDINIDGNHTLATGSVTAGTYNVEMN